jgi:proteasome lid subunit RPN8/RPN11
MEDKISNKSLSVIRDFLVNHSLKNTVSEICGFVGFDKEKKEYVATIEKNQANDPKSFFAINPVRYLKFKNSYSLVSVFHSHVIGDESASEFDIKMSESCCLSFLIYSINSNKFNIYEPQNKHYDVNILERIKVKFK